MKVEFLPSGSIDCPLIRIFGTDLIEHRLFLDAVLELRNGVAKSNSTDTLFGAPASKDCSLFMRLGEEDLGPASASGDGTFTWSLTRHGWGNVAELIKTIIDSPRLGTYQWIGSDNVGEVSVLLSYSEGGWW